MFMILIDILWLAQFACAEYKYNFIHFTIAKNINFLLVGKTKTAILMYFI